MDGLRQDASITTNMKHSQRGAKSVSSRQFLIRFLGHTLRGGAKDVGERPTREPEDGPFWGIGEPFDWLGLWSGSPVGIGGFESVTSTWHWHIK